MQEEEGEGGGGVQSRGNGNPLNFHVASLQPPLVFFFSDMPMHLGHRVPHKTLKEISITDGANLPYMVTI